MTIKHLRQAISDAGLPIEQLFTKLDLRALILEKVLPGDVGVEELLDRLIIAVAVEDRLERLLTLLRDSIGVKRDGDPKVITFGGLVATTIAWPPQSLESALYFAKYFAKYLAPLFDMCSWIAASIDSHNSSRDCFDTSGSTISYPHAAI